MQPFYALHDAATSRNRPLDPSLATAPQGQSKGLPRRTGQDASGENKESKWRGSPVSFSTDVCDVMMSLLSMCVCLTELTEVCV